MTFKRLPSFLIACWSAITVQILAWPVSLCAMQPTFSAGGRLTQADGGQSVSGPSGGSVGESNSASSYNASAGGSNLSCQVRCKGSGIWYPSAGSSMGGVICVTNPSALAGYVPNGDTQAHFNLSITVSYSLKTHGEFGIFRQAIASVGFGASTAGSSVSGSADSTNGPYGHGHGNSGVFEGQGEGGGSVSVLLPVAITASGTSQIEIPFSMGVSGYTLDISGLTDASAQIDASFSGSLLDSNGGPLPDLGICVLPQPPPVPDNTGPDDKHTGCETENGMAAYSFHTKLASLRITDSPVGYDPPYGYAMRCVATYTQRTTSQPSNFNFSNFGPKWNLNWLSYVTDDPTKYDGVSGHNQAGGGKQPIIFARVVGGGSGGGAGHYVYAFPNKPNAKLRREVANPLPYEIEYSDGSKEVYNKTDGATVFPRKVFMTQRIDPAGNITTISYDAQNRITRVTDPLGQDLTFSYDHPSDPLKITKVTDPFGRFALFQYDSAGRLSKITDVIGIESGFTYQGFGDFINSLTTPYGTTTFTNTETGSVRRVTATDPAGDTEVIESNIQATPGVPSTDPGDQLPAGLFVFNGALDKRNTFHWNKKQWKEGPNDYSKAHIYHWALDRDFASVSDTLESEKTPLQSRIWYAYPGQSGPTTLGTQNQPSAIGRLIEGGTQLKKRTFNETRLPTLDRDPIGRQTAYNYASNNIDVLSVTKPKGITYFAVNAGGGSLNPFTSDSGFAGGDTYGNSNTIDLSGASNAAPAAVYQSGRYGTEFTYSADGLAPAMSYIVRLHFAENYFSSAGRRVADVQINGTTVLTDFDVFVAAGNAQHKAVVREFTAQPDASGKVVIRFLATVDNAIVSGIELLQSASSQPVLASYTWNTQHRPLTATDAAGQVTHYTWNSVGQMTSFTNAKNETTTFSYYTADASGHQRRGRLHQADGALPGSADVVTFDYDAVGLVSKVTGPDGYFLSFTYDELDRLKRVTFPDNTYNETTYTALDPHTRRDRLGRITTYVYNSIRQLESVTDPLGRTIQYRWCKCGALSQLIDAMGRATRWKHDVASRVTAKIYADGSTITYTYQPLSGRLSYITDEKKQVKTRSYNLDDTLSGIAYTHEEHETPDVFFTYDPEFRRLKTMLDGIGTTVYDYNPISPGTLGAGKLASVDGPLPDDTLTYAYDELGRNTGYSINGVGETRTFDPLGRLLTVVNPLGTFGYTYVGGTDRTDTVTYPNGMTCNYNYHPLTGDFRLKDIIHTLPGNTLLSRHSYEYNVVGNITRWTQISPQAGLNRSWLCGYDAADQLTSVTSQDPDTLANLPSGQYGYSYDSAGNRLTETIDGVTTTATVNALNQLTALSTVGVPTLPQQTYEWDAENRLVAINYTGSQNRSEFQFDGFGRRIVATERSSSAVVSQSRFKWQGFNLREKRNDIGDSVQKRYFLRGTQSNDGGNSSVEIVTRDHLVSAREVISGVGNVSAAYDFSPWGTRRIMLGAETGSDLGFGGYWIHTKSGLHMAPVRSYQTQIGRWLSRDRLPRAELLREGPNLYGFVSNSPVSLRDPSGYFIPLIVIEGGIALGELGGAAWSVYRAYRIAQTLKDISDVPVPAPAPTTNMDGQFCYPGDPGGDYPDPPDDDEDDKDLRTLKRLTDGEIDKLKKGDVDPHDLKPSKGDDLFKDPKTGNIYHGPMSGRGNGTSTGLNIRDF